MDTSCPCFCEVAWFLNAGYYVKCGYRKGMPVCGDSGEDDVDAAVMQNGRSATTAIVTAFVSGKLGAKNQLHLRHCIGTKMGRTGHGASIDTHPPSTHTPTHAPQIFVFYLGIFLDV